MTTDNLKTETDTTSRRNGGNKVLADGWFPHP